MTFGQAHERIDILMEKHDLPWFEPEEKDVFLNMATNEYVKTRYKEFEVNEKRREDLRTLIVTTTGSGASVAIPSDMVFALSLKGTFNIVCGNQNSNVETFIKPMQHDDINKVSKDPFNKADNEHPLYVMAANAFTIKSDSAPSSWTLVYLKRPIVVNGNTTPNTSFDLPEHTHEEIVNIAVRMMKAPIDPTAYQVQINENQNQE